MSFLAWIFLGLLAGVVATMIMPARTNWVIDILLGMAGASMGGFLFNLFGAPGVTGFNVYSLLVSVVGAVALLALVRIVQGKQLT